MARTALIVATFFGVCLGMRLGLNVVLSMVESGTFHWDPDTIYSWWMLQSLAGIVLLTTPVLLWTLGRTWAWIAVGLGQGCVAALFTALYLAPAARGADPVWHERVASAIWHTAVEWFAIGVVATVVIQGVHRAKLGVWVRK